jgi:hypothetical protein
VSGVHSEALAGCAGHVGAAGGVVVVRASHAVVAAISSLARCGAGSDDGRTQQHAPERVGNPLGGRQSTQHLRAKRRHKTRGCMQSAACKTDRRGRRTCLPPCRRGWRKTCRQWTPQLPPHWPGNQRRRCPVRRCQPRTWCMQWRLQVSGSQRHKAGTPRCHPRSIQARTGCTCLSRDPAHCP